MPSKIATLAVAVAAALSFAGCTKMLNTDKAEKGIKDGVASRTGVKVKSADCPNDVEVKKGDTFNCTVVAEDGSKATVKVTQKDDKGNITWELNPGK